MSTMAPERQTLILRAFDPLLDRMLDDRLLVLRDAPEEETAGGIALPQKRTEELKTTFGLVMAVGPGRVEADGVFRAPSVKVGDRIGFQNNAGYELVIGTVLYTVMRAAEILLVREGP